MYVVTITTYCDVVTVTPDESDAVPAPPHRPPTYVFKIGFTVSGYISDSKEQQDDKDPSVISTLVYVGVISLTLNIPTAVYEDDPTRRLLYATDTIGELFHFKIFFSGVVFMTVKPLNCTNAGAALADQVRWLPLPDKSYMKLPDPGYD